MADNDLAASQPEVEPGHIRPDEPQGVAEEKEVMSTDDKEQEQPLLNASSAEEPKAGASAPEQIPAQGDETEEDTVAAAAEQAVNPGPPAEAALNALDEQSTPTGPTQENAPDAAPTIVAPTPAKRFTSMNINKKFLAKTAASPSSSSSTATPKAQSSSSIARLAMPNPATPSRLITKKLTAAAPAPVVAGGWSLRATPPASLSSSPAPGDVSAAQPQPSAKPLGAADILKRPALVSSTSALSTDCRASAAISRDQSPVKAWAPVPVPPSELVRNLQDFPTAAEAAADSSEGKKPGVSAAQATHDATDAPAHTTEGDARDSFRGVHLDPKAHHWDEMEDESNDFLGEVIDFGDGKTYTVPPEEEEESTATPVSKEARFGDDYDRSWPRARPPAPDSESAHAGPSAPQHSRFSPTHGLPPRHPPGDGRVLFNERSNRLEPARSSTSTHVLAPSGPSHHHGPPHAHIPSRSAPRRNSTLSASERPKMGAIREPPPHARDPPPHAVPGMPSEIRARRPSDARSAHSPVERRSSFLHDEERPRMGSMAPRGRVSNESGSALHGVRRETSRDSRLGERQPWGVALQRTTSQRTATDSLHPSEPAVASDFAEPAPYDWGASVSGDNSVGKPVLSPSHQGGPLPMIPSPQTSPSALPGAPARPEAPSVPIVPAALNEEREKFMKQAAERARRRKMEEEAAREEARERARKKAAELEALSKASLVSASPLVALTRKSSAAGLSSGAKSPVPKSPSIAPSVLPPSSVISDAPSRKPQEVPEPTSLAATVSSWRAKAKPEPAPAPAPALSEPLNPTSPPVTTLSAQLDLVRQPPSTVAPGAGGGMRPIEELAQVEGPLEVLDFSDMSKLAGRRTSVTNVSEVTRTKRSGTGDFLDEAPASKRPGQAQPPFIHWNQDTRLSGDFSEDRARMLLPSSNKHTAMPSRQPQENLGLKSTPTVAPSLPNLPSRSGFKEAPISALDDVMSRIKGVLTGMHAGGEKSAAPAVSAPTNVQPPTSTPSHLPPTPASTTPALPLTTARANPGATPRWKGDGVTNWRDGANKRQPNGRPVEAQPTEPFATTRPERAETPPPAWKTYHVHLNKSNIVRPPMSKKQVTLAMLPPMPVRWDILTWDPPVERMSTRTLSRDDMFFPKIIIRGVLSARVLLPSTGSNTAAQSTKQAESPVQRTRLMPGPDTKNGRSPNVPARVVPKGPAFSDNQWRKPQATSPLRNSLELHDHVPPMPAELGEEDQLETVSRSPPPHHMPLSQAQDTDETDPMASESNQTLPRQSWGTDVAFHRSLHEKRPSAMSSVSFTVSSELDNPSTSEVREATPLVSGANPAPEDNISPKIVVETAVLEVSGQANGDATGEKPERAPTGDGSGDKATLSPTPNSSVLLTPPTKVTTPWQASNSRLPDADYIKSVWQHTPPKEGAATENSLRGLADDFPSSIPHSVQEMKADDEPKPSRELAATVSTRVQHNAHRGFQQVPTSPVPMHILNYPNTSHMPPGPSRPMPVSSFSLPPPAPPQVTSQPSPYSPYVHPTPPALMYTIPPSRIAPSPAPGGPQMWMQNQAYGRPSPPAGMYPTQHGHNMPYPSGISQMPPALSKPQAGMNGNHGHHPMSSPAMSHAMHMGSPAMAHVGHMGSPALGHATPHMPGGPQHMYPGMNSPGGLAMGANMPYGVQRPTPTMMQQSPMQPLSNGYGMPPGGPFNPAGYGRGNVRSPADGMPHHMAPPHQQHAPMSPGTYHPTPNGYVRSW